MKLTKCTLVVVAAVILSAAVTPVLAGFKGNGADGEDLGRPARPNPTPGGRPAMLPEDPVGDATRDKMKRFICDRLIAIAKKQAGIDEWDLLQPEQHVDLIIRKLQQDYDSRDPRVKWADLPEERRQQIVSLFLNDRAFRVTILCRIWNELGCALYDNLNDAEKADLKAETALIEDMGLEAWNALSDERKAELKGAVDFDARAADKVKAARCNVKKAIELIRCIPAPDKDTPSGAMVADCLMRTWERRRICIDFDSAGAFGSIKPNCAGKARGVCDPDNNPINISVRFIPCTKRDKIYDPELYTLMTTLYHEGIHALQAFGAKPVDPGEDATPEEEDAYLGELVDRLIDKYCNELEAHGSENTLIDALCAEVLNVANGRAADAGEHPYLMKVLVCLTGIEEAQPRRDTAQAFKDALNFNKWNNDSALRGYREKKRILQNDGLNNEEKILGILRLRKVSVELDGNPVTAGGPGGVVEQVEFDPVTGDPHPRDIITPLEEIFDLHLALEGNFVFVLGADHDAGEGVLLAYSDADGDGFLDQGTELPLLRHPLLLDPCDIIDDPTNGQFIMANLVTGELFALFEGPEPFSFDLLPDTIAPIGNLGFGPRVAGLIERIVLSPDGTTVHGLPGIHPAYPPIMLPELPIAGAVLDEVAGQFLPIPPVHGFDAFLFPPVVLEANGLPVFDTTSVISDQTTELRIGGVPNGHVQLLILPNDLLLPPVPLGPEGQAPMPLPIPLQPGMELVLQMIDPLLPSAPPLEIVHYVRDSTPQLVNVAFDPATGINFDLIGVPGMPHQILHSPDLVTPFQPLPILPPVTPGLDGTLHLQGLVLDPQAPNGFFKAQTAAEARIEGGDR